MSQVDAKSTLQDARVVTGTGARLVDQLAALRALGIEPIVASRAQRPTVARTDERGVRRAGAQRQESSLGDLCRLRQDVDDAVDGIRAPHRCPWSPHDFDAIDVVEHVVLKIPVDAGRDRRVDDATVDEHEQLVRPQPVEAARRHRPLVAIDLRHLEARHETQQIGQRRRTRASDVFTRQHVDGGRCAKQLLLLLRDRTHFYLQEVLEIHRTEVDRILCVRTRGQCRDEKH